MPHSDVKGSLHNVEHSKRVFSFYLFITQVIMPKLSYCVYVQQLFYVQHSTTGFEGEVWNDCKKATSLCHSINFKPNYLSE